MDDEQPDYEDVVDFKNADDLFNKIMLLADKDDEGLQLALITALSFRLSLKASQEMWDADRFDEEIELIMKQLCSQSAVFYGRIHNTIKKRTLN